MAKAGRRLLQGAALALVVACLFYVIQHIDRLALADRLHRLSLADAGPLIGALLLVTTGLVCVNCSWVLLLQGFSSPTPAARPSARHLLAISLTWQLAKYLPANLFHFIGRTGEACRAGIGVRAAVAANLAEIALLAGLGVILAALCLGVSQTPLPIAALPFVPADAAPAVTPDLVLAVAGFSALLLGLAVTWRWQRVRAAAARSAAASRLLGAGALVFLFFPAFVAASLIAAPVDGTGSTGSAAPPLLAVAGVLIAAWIAGFVVPGAPGGLGVREALILAALTPSLGSADATWLAFVQRALAVGADLACFVLGLVLRMAARPPMPAPMR